jgi:hypothetical protein
LEGVCLPGKRANYKFRLLPWCFAVPSTEHEILRMLGVGKQERKERNGICLGKEPLQQGAGLRLSSCLYYNADKEKGADRRAYRKGMAFSTCSRFQR